MKKREQLGISLIILLGMIGDSVPRGYLPPLLALALVICISLAISAFRAGLSRAPHF
jgi:hypothetical protein